MELLRSTGKALSQRTSQRHPHSKGIDDALRPGALPRPASESNPDRPPGRPTAQLGACLPSMCACCMQWRVHQQMSCYHTSHKLVVYADDESDEEKCIDQALVLFFSVMTMTPLFTITPALHMIDRPRVSGFLRQLVLASLCLWKCRTS